MAKVKSVHPDSKLVAYYRILYWFFSYPTRDFTLNEICRGAGASKTSAHDIILALYKDEFLEKTELGNLWRLRANQRHPFFLTKKIPHNLDLIYNSEILDTIRQQHKNIRAVILFGSYRWGDDIETSDIDIAIEINGNEPVQTIELGTISQFDYRTNVKVNLYLFSRNNVDLNVFTNIANGIVLDGLLEVKP